MLGYKIKYNFKDGRSYTVDANFPNEEEVLSEFFKLAARGRNNNSTLKFDNETLQYEDVESILVVFE